MQSILQSQCNMIRTITVSHYEGNNATTLRSDGYFSAVHFRYFRQREHSGMIIPVIRILILILIRYSLLGQCGVILNQHPC